MEAKVRKAKAAADLAKMKAELDKLKSGGAGGDETPAVPHRGFSGRLAGATCRCRRC